MEQQNKTEELYECDSCGATSPVPSQCCGKPMKQCCGKPMKKKNNTKQK